jgi:hypothetical protein
VTASANGWRVIARDECRNVEVPGGILPVHPEFAWLFWDLAHEWHETVEPLLWPGCWGWADRPIAGSTTISNHASGTAIDLSAPKHPRGVPIGKTFTPAQLLRISQLETRYFGVLRWGGRWTGASVDGMHWEGIPGVTVEAVRELTATLSAKTPAPAPVPPAPGPAPAKPKPAPKPAPTPTGPDLRGTLLSLRGDQGNSGRRVANLQEFLRARYPLYSKALVVDGVWGPKTTGVLREYAHRNPHAVPSADGANIGPKLARKLYLSGFRG